MLNFDFSGARNKHREWKTRLAAFLQSGTGLTVEQVSSEHDCDLGRWIYGDGLKKYGSIPEMNKLEACHKTLHVSVRAVVQAKHANKDDVAQTEFAKVKRASEDVVSLLNMVEAAVRKTAAAAK